MLQTTLCYITYENRVLMLHRIRKKNDINAGKWLGIGGKLEPGETPEECLLREVWEETGFTLRRWRYRGIVDFLQGDWKERMHLYTADRFDGEPHACREGILAWVLRSEVTGLSLWEGDRVFLKLIEEDAPFFHLKLTYGEGRLISANLVPLE